MNFDTIGGRRYVLVWAVFIASCVLVWFGKINPDVWANTLMWSVGAYLAANVAQRHIEAKASKEQ